MVGLSVQAVWLRKDGQLQETIQRYRRSAKYEHCTLRVHGGMFLRKLLLSGVLVKPKSKDNRTNERSEGEDDNDDDDDEEKEEEGVIIEL